MAISEQWVELLEPGLRAIFEEQTEALAADSRIPLLFNVQGSNKSQEHDLMSGGFGDWNEYKGTIEYHDNEQGFKTTYTHTEYVDGFKVERKLVDDDLYNQINARPMGLALSAMRTREKHAASVFNNAFSSSYAGGDGVALCSASHPYSPSNATTQSNTGTSALSYDNVITTRRLMREYKDDVGELIPMNPDTLLVPPELEDTAFKIMNANGEPDSADRNPNFVSSRIRRVITWDYLTDANNWFLMDSRWARIYLNWFDRTPLEFASDPTGDFRLEARYRGYMRYSYGWSNWKWVYGHNVT